MSSMEQKYMRMRERVKVALQKWSGKVLEDESQIWDIYDALNDEIGPFLRIEDWGDAGEGVLLEEEEGKGLWMGITDYYGDVREGTFVGVWLTESESIRDYREFGPLPLDPWEAAVGILVEEPSLRCILIDE